MKRKITLTIIIFLIGLISLILITKEKNVIKETKEANTSSFISMMVEQDAGSSNYVENTDIKFPLEGYHFNSEESGCENGGILSWNSEKQKVEASLLTSDKCYAYFDNVQVKSEFAYTGDYEEYVVPSTGTYKIELWGAQGGGAYYNFGDLYEDGSYEKIGDYIYGGKGAYVEGNIKLKKGAILYIYVGGMGKDYTSIPYINSITNGGYNGGGYGGYAYQVGGSGGGATDIRLNKGNWDNFESLMSRIMVAGAGGGTSNYLGAVSGGNAGGLIGESGQLNIGSVSHPLSTGGTQNAGGTVNKEVINYNELMNGSLGKGGNSHIGHGGGGGAGYYGGGGGTIVSAGVSSGAGGSSFISGYPGCDAIAENSTEDAIIHTGESVHYSGKIFTDYEMIAGNAIMPSPDGGTEEGHTGNGYARITLVK